MTKEKGITRRGLGKYSTTSIRYITLIVDSGQIETVSKEIVNIGVGLYSMWKKKRKSIKANGQSNLISLANWLGSIIASMILRIVSRIRARSNEIKSKITDYHSKEEFGLVTSETRAKSSAHKR